MNGLCANIVPRGFGMDRRQTGIQMGIERIKDEPFGKSRLIARQVTRYFVAGLSTSYST